MNNLIDTILTYIERREAEHIQYALYDVWLTGENVLKAFSDEPEAKVHTALDTLWRRGLIMRCEDHADHRQWRFRSRMTEIVRLVSKLRQRKGDHVDKSSSLVHDLKFEVRARQVPERHLCMADLAEPLQSRYPDVADILIKLFPQADWQFSDFQQRAFQIIIEKFLLKASRNGTEGLVITANTGAGKTYAFFLPVLAYCLAEKGLRGQIGTKAICIYPRVALSENQLEDFVNVLYQANQHLPPEHQLTVGIDSGASPYTLYDFTHPDNKYLQNNRGWRWDAENTRYICPFARCPACGGELAVKQANQPDAIFCTQCGEQHPFILYAKAQFREAPPDILVATTESLNSRMMDSKYAMLFGNEDFPPPAVVMLDEIHLQSSTKGMQIGFLLRRLAARIRLGARGACDLMMVGLSATIAQPQSFFADLTGLPSHAITKVAPNDDEMQTTGAERYLFVRAAQEEDTAVIATLLHTTMLIVHTMPQPSQEEQEAGVAKYKTFGFTESLDIVERWYDQLTKYEHPPHLYRYRLPGDNRQLSPNYFGLNEDAKPCPCPGRGYPDLDCIYFQEGECWWALLDGLPDPMQLKRKSARDRQVQITPDDDLIITTTALEVGYDDNSLMGVIQYQSPSNVASFVQRKGRGGRAVGTRPIIITVFSPYKASDVFLYQNDHLLVDPHFKKLPLNPSNPFLQRIHGFYALLDWLAYRAAQQGQHLALGNQMEARDYATLLRLLTGQDEALDDFRNYLAEVFSLEENPTQLQALLVAPDVHLYNEKRDYATPSMLTKRDKTTNDLHSYLAEVLGPEDNLSHLGATLMTHNTHLYNDNGLLTQGLLTLMEALHQNFDNEGQLEGSFLQPVKARADVLRAYLPQNLFSDVNLPELEIIYDKNHKLEDIALGLRESIPGNVTFRGGQGACWIELPLEEGQVFILEDAYTLSYDPGHTISIDVTSLPARIKELIQAQVNLPRSFDMIRPTEARMVRFDSDEIRCTSRAYPLEFTVVDTLSPSRAFSFTPHDHASLFSDLGKALFKQVDFSSDRDAGRLMKVRQVIVGSQYSLTLQGTRDPSEGIVTFARRDAPGDFAALGYEMQTEGITFTLANGLAEIGTTQLPVSAPTVARLRRAFVKHAVITDLSARLDVNYFAAERFAEVLLTVADLFWQGEFWSLEATTSANQVDREDVRRALAEAAEQIYHLSPQNTQAVMDLFDRTDVGAIFAKRYAEIHTGDDLYRHYLEDTFVHTLKHALKRTAQVLAGVEAREYITATTQLNMDFGELRDRRIWLYELGMGGVGVLHTVQDVLRDNPARFWRLLETTLATCETEQEDRFLLDILGQPEETLHALHTHVSKLQAASPDTRDEVLRALRETLHQSCGLFTQPTQMRVLIKMFSDDHVQQELGLCNWRLYWELNIKWVRNLTIRLGRPPTPTEAQGLLHYELTHPDDAQRQKARKDYPEATRLLDIYTEKYAEHDVCQVFENVVGRRLLLNCRDACPVCLDEGAACQVDSPGLSTLTLSRALVNEVFAALRHKHTVEIREDIPLAKLAKQVSQHFQQDPAGPVFVSSPADRPDLAAALLSYLTDYGIVEHLERHYPNVTQVKIQDDILILRLSLEHTRES